MLEKESKLSFKGYQDTVENLKEILQNRLSELAIKSAIFFGSSTFGGNLFKEGVSDLDVCAFTDEMKPENYASMLNRIKGSVEQKFMDKPPILLNDHIADRIEFYLEFPQINVDVTIMPPGLPRLDMVDETATHDSLELLFANFYQYGVPFIGDVPLKDEMNKKFLPFYDDVLRVKRLDILTSRVQKNNHRVLDGIAQGRADIFDDVYKSREFFLKWLFIYNREYPICLRKHIEYQLRDFINMDEKEIQTLLFSSDNNMIDLSKRYVNLTENYLEKYRSEEQGGA